MPMTRAIASAAVLLVWSIGCKSGRTDPCAEEALLARAREAVFSETSLRELPSRLHETALVPGTRQVRPVLRTAIELRHQDLRGMPPAGAFDVVRCRNVAFAYFDDALRRVVAARLGSVLTTGGYLVLGRGAGGRQGRTAGADGRGRRSSGCPPHVRQAAEKPSADAVQGPTGARSTA